MHYAVLKNGDEVVVKVQRKGIHDIMSRDITMLHKAVRLVPPVPIKGIVDFDMVLDEMWAVAQEENEFSYRGFEHGRVCKEQQGHRISLQHHVYTENTQHRVFLSWNI